MSFLYQNSKYPFQNFLIYLNSVLVKHSNLPEPFINRELNEIISNSPEVSFEINSSIVDKDVFKTNFLIRIKLEIHCKNKETAKEEKYEIYNVEMNYEALTNIKDSDNVPEEERKKILMVDVPYLVFPFVRQQIFTLTESMKSTPVQLNNISFQDIFMQQLEKAKMEKENCENNIVDEKK